MNVAEFIDKWKRSELTERSAAQQHFLDLCALFDHPTPAEIDPAGDHFTFEKGAEKKSGADGWADVWKKGYFAWEYKGKHKDLEKAYLQLDDYRAALGNPPLLVTCDMDRFVVHTNFTNTDQKTYEIPLVELGEPRHLEILRERRSGSGGRRLIPSWGTHHYRMTRTSDPSHVGHTAKWAHPPP